MAFFRKKKTEINYVYRMESDDGFLAFVRATNDVQVIEWYCNKFGASRDWVDRHCRVINCGRCKSG